MTHVCHDCLSLYKVSKAGRSAKKSGGAWGRGLWPASVYTDSLYRKCDKHRIQALADCVARRAGLDLATPPWADRAAIKAVYQDSIRLTVETGVSHEVDHIVPLNGALVSGLHVHWNLKAIPAGANRTKSNHFHDG